MRHTSRAGNSSWMAGWSNSEELSHGYEVRASPLEYK
jgi:hypothetical protein